MLPGHLMGSGELTPSNASVLFQRTARSLHKDASPQLRHPWDAIALAVHAMMVAVGFRLVGLDEDHRIGEYSLRLQDLKLIDHIEQINKPPTTP